MRYHPSNLAISKSRGLLTTATKTRETGWITMQPSTYPSLSIEFFNQRIDLLHLFLNADPVIRFIPLCLDFMVSLALLLHPGEIFQIVDPLAIQVTQLEHVIGRFTQQ